MHILIYNRFNGLMPSNSRPHVLRKQSNIAIDPSLVFEQLEVWTEQKLPMIDRSKLPMIKNKLAVFSKKYDALLLKNRITQIQIVVHSKGTYQPVDIVSPNSSQ